MKILENFFKRNFEINMKKNNFCYLINYNYSMYNILMIKGF